MIKQPTVLGRQQAACILVYQGIDCDPCAAAITHIDFEKLPVLADWEALAVQAVVAGVSLACAVSSDTLSLATLPNLGMQLSNTFGLFCVLTLLGYSLVAIQRHLWKRSCPEEELRLQLYRCVPLTACLPGCFCILCVTKQWRKSACDEG